MRHLLAVVGSGVAAGAIVIACSSFAAQDDPAPPSEGGTLDAPVPLEAGAEAAVDAARPVICPDGKPPSKAPWTIGFYDVTGGTFELFSQNAPRAPSLTVQSKTSNAIPIVYRQKSIGDTVGWYLNSDHTFRALKANVTDAPFERTLTMGADAITYEAFSGEWNGAEPYQFGVYLRSSGELFLEVPVTGNGSEGALTFGASNDEARVFSGDWDGDGTDGIGLFVPSAGQFFLKNVATSGEADITFSTPHAGPQMQPVVGDWDGCGPIRVGVFDTATGILYLLRTNTAAAIEDRIDFSARWANRGAVPLAGRWQQPLP